MILTRALLLTMNSEGIIFDNLFNTSDVKFMQFEIGLLMTATPICVATFHFLLRQAFGSRKSKTLLKQD